MIDYGKNRGSGEPASGNNSDEWTSEKNRLKAGCQYYNKRFFLRWNISSFTITELNEHNLAVEWSVKGTYPKGATIYIFKR